MIKAVPSDSMQDRLVVLLPVFNDWAPARILLRRLDKALAQCGCETRVLLVNDGSTEPIPADLALERFETLRAVEVLHLRTNVGHQRAIAVGLMFIWRNRPPGPVVVMDADGQDLLEDVIQLVDRFRELGEQKIVFAQRRRLERVWFQALYYTYRWVHRMLTGDPVRVGNLSILPFPRLGQLAVIPEIWNHYAAAIIRSRLPFETVPIDRGQRLAGRSRMNLTGLIMHGLSAFFVYGDIIGTRLLVGVGVLVAGLLLLAVAGLGLHAVQDWQIPDWLPIAVGFSGVLLLEAILVALVLIFTVVGSGANARFLPIRDCPNFEDRLESFYEEPGESAGPA